MSIVAHLLYSGVVHKGGTLAPVFDGECSRQVIRSHMRELNQIYGGAIRL